MFNRLSSRKTLSRLSIVAALAGALSITAESKPAYALASPQVCTPTDVAYNQAGFEIIICGGNNYVVWLSGAPAGCGVQSTDTLKLWTGMASSALLAGKKLQMIFNTCNNGQFGITQMDLLQ